jgi:threonine/homoserine/homoserine lactone efflux protein
MYTPGPSNLLSLNAGLNRQISSGLRFCLGVACAMLLLFLLFGYSGSWLIDPSYQLFISSIGSLYIAYLGLKVIASIIKPESLALSEKGQKQGAGKDKGNRGQLNFKSGLIMQLLNPKSFVAIFPIVTVQFPAAEISGGLIFAWSLLLSILAFGAPSSYLFMGARLSRLISRPYYFRLLNLAMAVLLLYVAADLAYNHVYVNWAV